MRSIAAPQRTSFSSSRSKKTRVRSGVDFVVVMSGEPQGGIKARHREPRRNDFFGGGGFGFFWD